MTDPTPGDLTARLYDELRALAADHLRRERTGHTLQPTALVHEAWLRLSRLEHVRFEDRAAFVRAAAGTIRRVLVDHARHRGAEKRGGDRRRLALESFDGASAPPLDVLDLHEALEALAEHHPRRAAVVELRAFGGMTVPEAAAVLDVGTTTVDDDWAYARAWLRERLESGEA